MVNWLHVAASILAGTAVAIADALIKKVSINGDFLSAIKDPLMIAILILYLAQIIFFIYVFTNGWNLGVVGILQMVFYALAVILIGLFYFGESLKTIQAVGIIIALIGVILMNL